MASWSTFHVLGRHKHAVACVHCENTEIIGRRVKQVKARGGMDLAAWNAARPSFAEAEHVRRAGYFAELAGCNLYYVHIGAELGLEEAMKQRARYENITIETCPHYLMLTEEFTAGHAGQGQSAGAQDARSGAYLGGCAVGRYRHDRDRSLRDAARQEGRRHLAGGGRLSRHGDDAARHAFRRLSQAGHVRVQDSRKRFPTMPPSVSISNPRARCMSASTLTSPSSIWRLRKP